MTNSALLVGVDRYTDPANDLNSCVADTLAFRQVLLSDYGFAPGQVRLLHNSDATLANTLAALEQLFAGAAAGDHLVFLQSSHGWRYPEGDTMVEVLCCHDDFLKDTELASRTAGLPPGVLTAVFDSCHSGGMDKVFFPSGGTQVARAKVWQPTPEQQRRTAELYGQVTRFKFFGRAATADTGAVAKAFQLDPSGVAPAKDLGEGAVNLNGAVFAACRADQTAAAGTPATNNLSAFTYAVLQELDPSLSLSDLQERVAKHLDDLNMSQVPVVAAPPQQRGLLSTTFISGQAALHGGTQEDPGDGEGGTGGFDPFRYLRDQLGGVPD